MKEEVYSIMGKHGIILQIYKLTFFYIKFSVLKDYRTLEQVFSMLRGSNEKEYI
jgi:hypothetical protein